MTKKELQEEIARRANKGQTEDGVLDRHEVGRVVDATVALIHDEVKKGRDVRIPDLGRFYMQKRKARKGRNPQTGETIKIKAKKAAKFSAAKPFKDLVA